MMEKVYFLPGDIVTLKQNVPNKPTMIVDKVIKATFRNEVTKEEFLKGIKCRWFTKDGVLQEAIWNTKDLLRIDTSSKVQ